VALLVQNVIDQSVVVSGSASLVAQPAGSSEVIAVRATSQDLAVRYWRVVVRAPRSDSLAVVLKPFICSYLLRF
jgi:hypothetical protein